VILVSFSLEFQKLHHFRLFSILPQAKMIMNKPAQEVSSFPAIIEPDYEQGPLRKRFKKICSIHQSKYSPIPCPPSVVSGGWQHPANLQSSIPHTVIIVQKEQRPNAKDWIETAESSSTVNKRKRASTSPQNTMPLMKPRPLCIPLKIPSSPSSGILLPLGRPLALAPNLPRLAPGRAIPKLYVQ
jgi:hypothetical protein